MKEYEAWSEYIQANSTKERTKQNVLKLKDYYLAYASFLQGQYEESLVHLNKYLENLEEENDNYRTLLAKILKEQGKVTEAVVTVKRSNLQNPYNQYFYASFLKETRQTEAYSKSLEKIVSLNERNSIDLALVRRKAVRELEAID